MRGLAEACGTHCASLRLFECIYCLLLQRSRYVCVRGGEGRCVATTWFTTSLLVVELSVNLQPLFSGVVFSYVRVHCIS